MGKLKVHELAKELGLESKELIKKAKEVGIEVTSHLSSLEEEQIQKIKNIFNEFLLLIILCFNSIILFRK